jgi:hypothetical protein
MTRALKIALAALLLSGFFAADLDAQQKKSTKAPAPQSAEPKTTSTQTFPDYVNSRSAATKAQAGDKLPLVRGASTLQADPNMLSGYTPVNIESGNSPYTIQPSDVGQMIFRQNTVAQLDTVPAATTAGFFPGFRFVYHNDTVGNQLLIPGGGTFTLAPHQTIELFNDGSGWSALWGVPRPATQTHTTCLYDDWVWASCGGGGGGGGVTSITAGTGLSGGTITTAGTIGLVTPVSIANGGTGAGTSAAALAALGGAPLASPALTGTPTAPTPAGADNSTKIATTAFVQSTVGAGGGGTITGVTAGTGLAGGGTSGTVTVNLQTPVAISNGGTGAGTAAAALTALGGAPLASPTFTGTPAAPTPAPGDSTTKLATTAFVANAIGAGGGGTITGVTAGNGLTGGGTSGTVTVGIAAPVSLANGGTAATTAVGALASLGAAPLASPALSGTPTAPTATAGTSTTQLATTAFVTTADNLKAPLASPTFTGTPAAPTAAPGTNTTQLATTAFVAAAVTGGAGSATALGPGLTKTPGTQNTGSDIVGNSGSISGQLWPVKVTANCTINTSCNGSVTNETAEHIIINAASLTVTLPAIGTKGNSYLVGSDGTNLGTVSAGSTNIYGCVETATSITIHQTEDVVFEDDGAAWKCTMTQNKSIPLSITFGPNVNPNGLPFANFSGSRYIIGIRCTMEAALGTAGTIDVYKAASGTALASGTKLTNTTSCNANGTAATDQTLAGTAVNWNVNGGDRLGLVTSGTWTGTTGAGVVTVFVR